MHRRTLFAPLALLALLGSAACSASPGTADASDASPSLETTAGLVPAAPAEPSGSGADESASADATSDGAAASVPASPTGAQTVRTQPGGGTLQFAGEYTDTVTVDSTYCLFFADTLMAFQAPAEGEANASSGGWVVTGDAGKIAFGKDDTITGGTIQSGVTVNGTSLDFDDVQVTVTKSGEANYTATLSGRLTCSEIEN